MNPEPQEDPKYYSIINCVIIFNYIYIINWLLIIFNTFVIKKIIKDKNYNLTNLQQKVDYNKI